MIVVLARVPEPGHAKTRLVPALGAVGAATLAEAMARDVLTVAGSVAPVRVAFRGDETHPWVRTHPEREPQVEGDLGDRLTHALRDGGTALGTDAPTMPRALLLAARAALTDVAIAPAFDGGYVLLHAHASAVARGLFRGIPWSASTTFASQLHVARSLGLTVTVLPFWYDIDTPADLDFLRTHLPTLPADIAPATRRCLGVP